MIQTDALLPDLQHLVKNLKADLLERLREHPEIDARLRAEAYTPVEKGGRTAQAYEVWRDDYLEHVAVAWVLACVFVRFLEDNDLIAETYLAGITPDRRRQAEDAHQRYLQAHPHESDRDYLLDVFRRVGSIAAARDLFAEGKTPLWALGPSGDGAATLLAFWRAIDPATGELIRPLREVGGDTRFLGDLYQDLSESARKRFALLQTPGFVEEFILDHTLTPALDAFGLESARLIDPTCGSGHFLLGAFRRLFALWNGREPATDPTALAQRALDAVYGVDLNPFAVAIARFRLIVEAMHLCGLQRLDRAPGWTVHVVVGDSLMHGDSFDERGFREQWLPGDEPWSDPIYAVEDPAGLQAILNRQYHTVVGNPPYITVKDSTLNARYRNRWKTCHRQYSLGVPFTERFFNLAVAADDGRPPGFVGMITANSFLKREMGKKLIEDFLPKVDLTHVIDTSGASIPGHKNTPTVILFGRSRRPLSDKVRAVLGIHGEAITPEDPAEGLVWRSIVDHLDNCQRQNEFVTVTDVDRATFGKHPWSIGGGGAAELKEQLDRESISRLADYSTSIGFASFPGLDDAFVTDESSLRRSKIPENLGKSFITGDDIREWIINPSHYAFTPYDERFELIELQTDEAWSRLLWRVKTSLEQVVSFGGKTRKQLGDSWWGWYRWVEAGVTDE